MAKMKSRWKLAIPMFTSSQSIQFLFVNKVTWIYRVNSIKMGPLLFAIFKLTVEIQSICIDTVLTVTISMLYDYLKFSAP